MTTKADEHGGAGEHISALMDGELRGSAAHQAISTLQRDPELCKAWGRYHLIREALRKDLPDRLIIGDVAARVSHALMNEPTILAPRKVTLEAKFRALSPMLKQLSGLAIAASVTAVAILSVQTVSRLPSTNTSQIALAPPTGNEFTPAVVTTNSSPDSRNIVIAIPSAPTFADDYAQAGQQSGGLRRPALEAKLNYYLSHHNEYAMPTEMQGILPYARMVGYDSAP